MDKVVNLRAATLLKKRLWHSCFSVSFTTFLRTPFLQNTSWRLLNHLYPQSQFYKKCKSNIFHTSLQFLRKHSNIFFQKKALMFDRVLNIPLVGANFSTCWNTPRGSRSDRVNCVIKSEVNLTFSSGENYLEESVKEFVWFRFVESVYYPSRTLIVPFGICLYETFKQTFYIEIKLFCIIYFKLLSIYCLVFRTCFPKSCWMVMSTDSGNEISVIFFSNRYQFYLWGVSKSCDQWRHVKIPLFSFNL